MAGKPDYYPPREVESVEKMNKELEYAWEQGWRMDGRPRSDRVFLIQKDWLGSVLIQVVLVLFTFFVGNIIYIAYRWTQKPYKHVIRITGEINEDEEIFMPGQSR